jgi:polyisoprenoid-binding protein YceI
VTFRIVPEQSEARYRAREQLLGRPLPNDAVGRTNAVEGQIVFAADGTIDSQQSQVTVDLRTLKSDEARRDNYIKQNTLEVDRYPTATFQPTAASGLPWPLPTSGQLQFQLEGNLTVHGVTKPVTWNVEATVDGNRITGTATTQVTFDDFGMTPPRVPVVLSLEDTITLELNFMVERVL